MAVDDGASSITVAVRVRPFTIREAAQLVKTDDGPVFLGDGSLAAAPPKLAQKGIRPIIKVVDDKCLFVDFSCPSKMALTFDLVCLIHRKTILCRNSLDL